MTHVSDTWRHAYLRTLKECALNVGPKNVETKNPTRIHEKIKNWNCSRTQHSTQQRAERDCPGVVLEAPLCSSRVFYLGSLYGCTVLCEQLIYYFRALSLASQHFFEFISLTHSFRWALVSDTYKETFPPSIKKRRSVSLWICQVLESSTAIRSLGLSIPDPWTSPRSRTSVKELRHYPTHPVPPSDVIYLHPFWRVRHRSHTPQLRSSSWRVNRIE